MTDRIDLLDPALHARADLWDELARLRAIDPVLWCPGRRGPGYWAVLGHPELAAAARDTNTFSSWWGTRPEVMRPDGALRPLHNLDPPAHGVLRAIALRAVADDQLERVDRFTADAIARVWRNDVRELVTELIEPVVIAVFAAWLGLDDTEGAPLWSRVVAVHTAGARLLDCAADDPARGALMAEAADASRNIAALFTRALRDAPDGTVLAGLRDANLPAPDTVALAALLVQAGVPTTIDAIGSAIVLLAPHFSSLRASWSSPRDQALLLEEVLRLASPIAQFARRARCDTTLGTHTIRAGQQIVLWFGAANRDPRVFVDPDRLLPTRAPNPHFAFGVGPHRCLGAAMARQILRAVLDAFMTRDAPRLLVGHAIPRASSYQRGYDRIYVDSSVSGDE